MAVQLEGSDPVLRFFNGVVLQTANRLPEAEVQFRRAIELDPYYSALYYWLATNYDLRDDTTLAVQRYRQFLDRAAREDPNRPLAVRSLKSLGVAVDSL